MASGMIILALAGSAYGIIDASSAHSQNVQLSRQISTLQTRITQDHKTIVSLSNDISALTMPSDPLANYNDICNTVATNNYGVTQTYWYPCTNNSQITPLPGS